MSAFRRAPRFLLDLNLRGSPDVSALPLATRNFTQLLGLTAGVVTSPTNAENIGFGTLNPNVNGMRAGSNNYLLDGNVNNNPMNNAVEGVGTPSVSFLQEFKVITNKDEIVIGVSDAELADMDGNAGGIAKALVAKGSLSVWQYAVRKAPTGDLEQAPVHKVGLILSESLRIEPYATPLKVLPVAETK